MQTYVCPCGELSTGGITIPGDIPAPSPAAGQPAGKAEAEARLHGAATARRSAAPAAAAGHTGGRHRVHKAAAAVPEGLVAGGHSLCRAAGCSGGLQCKHAPAAAAAAAARVASRGPAPSLAAAAGAAWAGGLCPAAAVLGAAPLADLLPAAPSGAAGARPSFALALCADQAQGDGGLVPGGPALGRPEAGPAGGRPRRQQGCSSAQQPSGGRRPPEAAAVGPSPGAAANPRGLPAGQAVCEGCCCAPAQDEDGPAVWACGGPTTWCAHPPWRFCSCNGGGAAGASRAGLCGVIASARGATAA